MTMHRKVDDEHGGSYIVTRSDLGARVGWSPTDDINHIVVLAVTDDPSANHAFDPLAAAGAASSFFFAAQGTRN